MNVGRTDQNEAEAVALRSFRRAQRKETRPTYSYRNVLLLTLRRCVVAPLREAKNLCSNAKPIRIAR